MNLPNYTYSPIAVCSPFTTHNSQADNYAFASKERDTETGLSVTSLRSVSSLPLGHFRTSSNGTRWLRRFGARYYSSDLSIWLSVDPMVDKYPSLSPYVYCANNPVKLVDPNGEDYEVVVDEKARTITIKANYVSNKQHQQTLNDAIAAWNSQSGEYTFTTGEGDDTKTYSINIELSAIYFETDEEAQKAVPNTRDNTNYFSIVDLSGTDRRGQTVGINLQVDNNAPLRTTIHELGHSIGIYEGMSGVMISGGDSDAIYEEHIISSLNRAGIQSRMEYNCNVPEARNDAVVNKTYNMHGVFNHR